MADVFPFEHSTPIEYSGKNEARDSYSPDDFEARCISYITTWRQQCRSIFIQRRNIWDDCWKLYRGLDDFTMKQDWQSKIVLPKSFATVKMATNAIKRLLSAAKKPWDIEAINTDDQITALRAEQMTDLTKLFLDKAYFLKEFTEGLECAFILGLGVWKLWWGMVPRIQTRVNTRMVPLGQLQGPEAEAQAHSLLGGEPTPQQAPPPFAQPRFGYKQQNVGDYPTQLPSEYLNPAGFQTGVAGGQFAPPNLLQIPQMQQVRETVREEVLEGRLFMRAVDPYNFYWLPGSKLNRFVGTIEDIEIPKWELIRMAEAGIFPMEKVRAIQPRRIDERYKMSNLRFNETVLTQNGPNEETAVCLLTEYYGPLVWEGKIIEEYAHVVTANDSVVLLIQKNPFLHRKAPYVAFSPLALPFRTEGVGLIEMVRFIDKAISNLANLSVDTLVFKLLPLFEVAVETLENPEDIETGMVPGKILRKNLAHAGTPAIRPVEFNDVSTGASNVWAALDRSHQEGALISDIAEGLPRWRGQQTATESQLLSSQSESFMGGMASDIELEALDPIVNMSMDLIFQFIDTANDPRIASILGVGADILRGMSRQEIMEMILGDYKVKVTGITGQIMKSEMLQNLVQLMNLIGQNPESWLPYVNQDALLRRILECFRPHIHDIEDIVSDPEIAAAKKAAMQVEGHTQELVKMLPNLLSLMHEHQEAQKPEDLSLQLQKQQHEKEMSLMDIGAQAAQHAHEMRILQATQAGAQPGAAPQPGAPPPQAPVPPVQQQ